MTPSRSWSRSVLFCTSYVDTVPTIASKAADGAKYVELKLLKHSFVGEASAKDSLELASGPSRGVVAVASLEAQRYPMRSADRKSSVIGTMAQTNSSKDDSKSSILRWAFLLVLL